MKKIFVLGLLLASVSSWGQTFEAYLKKNAVEINFSDPVSDSQINVFKKYDLYMIGEMHGTQEPAKFVSYLADQFLKTGKKIQIGLEIPADLLGGFVAAPKIKNLKASRFFNNAYADGRASLEWRNLVERFTGNPNVKLFFYDIPDSLSGKGVNRDSLMYENVKKELIAKSSECVTLLLGGNIHNRITLFKGMKTMGFYLTNDSKCSNQRICSVNHEYKAGAMRNNMGEGLKLNTIEPRETAFSTSTSFSNYFCALPVIEGYPYTGILYTEAITPSTPIK